MKLWYRIVKWFMYKYGQRFFPELPRELWNIFRKVDIDIEYLRFQNKVLAVHQVDFVLDTVHGLEPAHKMFYKNMLLERGLMVYGYTLGPDNEVTRVDKSLVYLFETKKKLWNKGRNPKMLEQEATVSTSDWSGSSSSIDGWATQSPDEIVVTDKEEKKESDIKPEEYTGPIN